MTLTQLRTFVAVADAGSVRAAAARLIVAQPSVSAALASLQRELGVALVAREGRGLRLTPAGMAFAAVVRRTLGLLDHAVLSARSVDAPGRGTVRVTATTTAVERLLLPLVARFRGDHPEAGVSVQVGNRAAVWEALRDHAADFVIAGRPPVMMPARVLARAPNRLVLVGSTRSDRRTRRFGPKALGTETWLLREAGSGTRQATDDLLTELGIEPPTMILGSNGAIEQAVAVGLGVALISFAAVAGRIADGSIEVLPCPGTPLSRPWHLVAHASEPLSPTAVLLAGSMANKPGGFALTADGRRALKV